MWNIGRIFNSEGNSWDATGDHIQDAIDDLPAVIGGTVWLPRTPLHITVPIEANAKSLWLQGLGQISANVASPRIIADVAMPYMINLDKDTNKIQNVLFDGNALAVEGIHCINVETRIIRNAILRCNYGITTSNAANATYILNNFIEDNSLVGLYLLSDTNWILNNQFRGNNNVGGGDIIAHGVDYHIAHNFSWLSRRFFASDGDISGLKSHDNHIYNALTDVYNFTQHLINSDIHDDTVDGNGVTPNFLITAGGKTVTGVKVHDCNIANLTGAVFVEGATGKVEKHSNFGYNPVGNVATPYSVVAGNLDDVAAAQAFPTSATNYTVVGSPKLISIYGGTITSVSIDGVATGQSGAGSFCAYRLEPGQVLNVVWTGQPSSVIYAQ